MAPQSEISKNHNEKNGLKTDEKQFAISIEVVPPRGPDAEPILAALESLKDLPVDRFTVATNPVAKPCMSAMALCHLVQKRTGRPAVLHCTTRDDNRLSLQGTLWGAKAMGIENVMICTGDFVSMKDRGITTTVRDLNVFDLVSMAREANLNTGVVFDIHPEFNGLKQAVRRLKEKVDAGAQFVVTQPVYDEEGADMILEATRDIKIPMIMGILPLRTPRHAEFLHQKVAGISVPRKVRERIQSAEDSILEGANNAREMLDIARQKFSGACIMPPFDHYEVLFEIFK